MATEPAPAAPTPPTPPPPPPPTPPATPTTEPLGEAGLRALQQEREARAEAERAAREAKRERDALAAQLSDQDRAKHEAEEQKRLANKAIKNLRQANLELALAGHGITGPKAKAATKLIEGVEFNDEFQPVNLDNRLATAKELYGSEFFTGSAPTPPPPSAPPVPNGSTPPTDFHNGARPATPTADEDESFARAMGHFFPGVVKPAPSNP